MYYIYHIPGVKIGCTIELEDRIQSQGYSEYEILEQYSDIVTASDREIQLQKQYGYPVDTIPYWKTMHAQVVSRAKKSRLKALKTRGGVKTIAKEMGIKGGNTTKQKLSKPILAYEYPSMNFVGEFQSLRDTARALNVNHIHLSHLLNGRGKSLKGYTFNYKFPIVG